MFINLNNFLVHELQLFSFLCVDLPVNMSINKYRLSSYYIWDIMEELERISNTGQSPNFQGNYNVVQEVKHKHFKSYKQCKR